ncbi:MAG: M55 family metallopeptidase [Ignavibacteriales bacterium]|nr:M55 family metallopeptidase [Ignavibacteriales bacterium]
MKASAAILLLLFVIQEGNSQKLRVFISVDMEGITGLVSSDQVGRGGSDYQMARGWMTEEANSAILGALDAGATDVIVNDSHGDMRNLILAELNAAATLITGSPKPLSMMQGIDETFDAVLFIGYHPREGTTDGVLDHTISGGTVDFIRINGVEMPELGINALVAGNFNVPVVFISGDKAVCDQAKALLGDQIVTVAVKEGIGKRAAKSLPLKKAHDLIRSQVKTALEKRKDMRPYKLKGPYKFEVGYRRSSQADNASVIPGVQRLNAKTLQIESKDVIEGFKFMRGLINLGRDD